MTDSYDYDAFGLPITTTGTTPNDFLYSGEQYDSYHGLLYMRARYYNPYLCRFISADPSGFGGGLNFYAYAAGNPVSYLDPFGLGAIEPCTPTIARVMP